MSVGLEIIKTEFLHWAGFSVLVFKVIDLNQLYIVENKSRSSIDISCRFGACHTKIWQHSFQRFSLHR
jgi:hypothetical protein